MLLKASLLSLALTIACHAANIVNNPSFTSGASGWTLGTGINVGPPGNSGPNSAQSACVGSDSMTDPSCEMSQILTTNAGSTYTLSFWVTEDAGATSEMAISWDGTLVADILNPNNCNTCEGDVGPWLQFTFNNLVASSGSTLLQIFGRDDPGAIFFTDFSVDLQRGGSAGQSGVPEPSTVLLSCTGLIGMCWLGSRRRWTPYLSLS